MFTGIITYFGTVCSMQDTVSQGINIHLQTNAQGIGLGDSIACDGVCLTVSKLIAADVYEFNISRETQAVTTIPAWPTGYTCNLELALLAGERLGGHFVSGHVDGVAKVIGLSSVGDDWLLALQFQSSNQQPQWIEKGSITVNGVSLTINKIKGDVCHISLIPHTVAYSNLSNLMIDQLVNIEFDMFYKMVQARVTQYQEAR